MKILVMPYFIVMKWVFLIWILAILVLIIILMKMNLDSCPLLGWHIKFEKCKVLKKELNRKLMPVVRHPKR